MKTPPAPALSHWTFRHDCPTPCPWVGQDVVVILYPNPDGHYANHPRPVCSATLCELTLVRLADVTGDNVRHQAAEVERRLPAVNDLDAHRGIGHWATMFPDGHSECDPDCPASSGHARPGE